MQLPVGRRAKKETTKPPDEVVCSCLDLKLCLWVSAARRTQFTSVCTERVLDPRGRAGAVHVSDSQGLDTFFF